MTNQYTDYITGHWSQDKAMTESAAHYSRRMVQPTLIYMVLGQHHNAVTCHSCQSDFPYLMIDLHHTEDAKQGSPTHLMHRVAASPTVANVQILIDEFKDGGLIPLCSNCHRLEHYTKGTRKQTADIKKRLDLISAEALAAHIKDQIVLVKGYRESVLMESNPNYQVDKEMERITTNIQKTIGRFDQYYGPELSSKATDSEYIKMSLTALSTIHDLSVISDMSLTELIGRLCLLNTETPTTICLGVARLICGSYDVKDAEGNSIGSTKLTSILKQLRIDISLTFSEIDRLPISSVCEHLRDAGYNLKRMTK